MAIVIEQVDTRSAPDSLLEELWLYYHEVFAEEIPGDPPQSLARTVADWRAIKEFEEVPRWVLRDGRDIRAVAVAYVSKVDNLDNGFARIHVSAPYRRRGYARALAAPVFDWLQADGRKRLRTSVIEGGQHDDLLIGLGMEEAYHDQRSRLVLAEVDRDLMRVWIDRAGERASDYRLLELSPPIPDEHLQRYCDILFQMNTAPLEDLVQEDVVTTPEEWRETEAKNRQAGLLLHTIVAEHMPSGIFAGSTSVAADVLDPVQAWQWETVVHPEHRNRGLGRWLKAAMVELVVREHPDALRIDTENSVTNDAMLGINLEMGFKPVSRSVIWQGELASVRERWQV